jgi:hypothetical protein
MTRIADLSGAQMYALKSALKLLRNDVDGFLEAFNALPADKQQVVRAVIEIMEGPRDAVPFWETVRGGYQEGRSYGC